MKRTFEALSFTVFIGFSALCFVSLFSSSTWMFWSGITGIALMYGAFYMYDRNEMKKRKSYWEETGL